MKRKKCILHVGMHKTGTTSIQNVLFRSLDDKNFHYAELGMANHSAIIYSLFADKPENYHAHKARGLSKAEVEDFNRNNKDLLIKSFKKVNADVTEIISGEDIGYMNFNELNRMKDFLEEYFESIVIIAYIRPPVSYIQSAFQELVKHGLGKFDFTYCDPNYSRFEMFDKLFGSDNFIVRPFIKEKLYNKDIVDDFFHTLDINFNGRHISEKSNESISLEALSFLYIYQKHINEFKKDKNIFSIRNKLIKHLSKIGNSSLRFSYEVLQPVLEKNKKGLDFLEEKIGTRLYEEIDEKKVNVYSERDLLEIDEKWVKELVKYIYQDEVPKDLKINSDKDVALLVHQLKDNL